MGYIRKKFILYLLIAFLSMVSIYVFFIGIICINIGIMNTGQKGFWMPLFVGLLISYLTIRGFLLLISMAISLFKDRGIIDRHLRS